MGSKKIILPVPFMFLHQLRLKFPVLFCRHSLWSPSFPVNRHIMYACFISMLILVLRSWIDLLFPMISLHLWGVSGNGCIHPRYIKSTRIITEALVLDFGTAKFPHWMLRLIESHGRAFYLLEVVFSTVCKWTLPTGNRLWNWLQGLNFRFQPFVL